MAAHDDWPSIQRDRRADRPPARGLPHADRYADSDEGAACLADKDALFARSARADRRPTSRTPRRRRATWPSRPTRTRTTTP